MTTTRTQLPMPPHALPQGTQKALLTMAHTGLAEAATMRPAGLRYATAHLAALRAAAAVVAARAVADPLSRRTQPPSVWVLLVQVAPELGEWAAVFAAGTTKRAAAEAGIPRVVTAAEADDMVRTAGMFVDIVETVLGLRGDR